MEYCYWHGNKYFERNASLKCVSPKHFFLSSKNNQKAVVSVWERRIRFIYTYFVGLMSRITRLPSKLGKITLVYYKGIPLMVLVCIPVGLGAWFPVQMGIFFHRQKLPDFLQILSFCVYFSLFLFSQKKQWNVYILFSVLKRCCLVTENY